MDPGDGAELPQSRVRLVVHGEGAVADLFQGVEVVDRARPQHPLVEEGLNQRQDDLAIDVVLQMLVRLIADAHRLHPAIALDAIDDTLADRRLQAHAIDGLNMAALGVVHQIAQVAEVVLEDVHRAQPVQRPHRIIGVAHPAETIVPVAPALGELGHRGGHGGHDGAGLLIDAQLERDGGADHRLLPVQRHIEGPGPQLPVLDGLLQRRRDPRHDRLVIALIRAEEEGQLAFQPEGALVLDMGDRAVGGQPQRQVGAQIANVVGARGLFSTAPAPVR